MKTPERAERHFRISERYFDQKRPTMGRLMHKRAIKLKKYGLGCFFARGGAVRLQIFREGGMQILDGIESRKH